MEANEVEEDKEEVDVADLHRFLPLPPPVAAPQVTSDSINALQFQSNEIDGRHGIIRRP